ncbi:hypothetical protein BX667DRAFT_504286 [Coemansia mojavensis]|nr:hypothetical protein BX667DRAFT_504286 [Coemansia mojavensis]
MYVYCVLFVLLGLLGCVLGSPLPCANPTACATGLATRAISLLRRDEGSGGISLSTPAIIGLAIGGVVAIIAIGWIIHCCISKRNPQPRRTYPGYSEY